MLPSLYGPIDGTHMYSLNNATHSLYHFIATFECSIAFYIDRLKYIHNANNSYSSTYRAEGFLWLQTPIRAGTSAVLHQSFAVNKKHN